MVHVPNDANFWTYSRFDEAIDEVKRVGINFGAPGDRRDENGTLWLDYPNVGGPSPKLEVAVETADNAKYFRLHPSQIRGEGPMWVAASGVEGIRSVTIPVGTETSAERSFDVRLHFTEPVTDLGVKRKFKIVVQGKTSTIDLSFGARRGHVETFEDVKAKENIAIEFGALSGSAIPVVSGIEVVAK
jgi:hypothetical protein